MKIAVLGTGNVGGILGVRWALAGHQVTYGSRNPVSSRVEQLIKDSGGRAQASTSEDAVERSEVVAMTIPWQHAQNVIENAGSFEGKILIDCTNPLKEDFTGLSIGFNTSAGEKIGEWAKGAKVVKAFNSIGPNVMANPKYGADKAVLFICGNDKEAKEIVKDLAADLGFDVIDAGDLYMSRYLEQLAMLWINLAFRQGMGVDFALKLLHRQEKVK